MVTRAKDEVFLGPTPTLSVSIAYIFCLYMLFRKQFISVFYDPRFKFIYLIDPPYFEFDTFTRNPCMNGLLSCRFRPQPRISSIKTRVNFENSYGNEKSTLHDLSFVFSHVKKSKDQSGIIFTPDNYL